MTPDSPQPQPAAPPTTNLVSTGSSPVAAPSAQPPAPAPPPARKHRAKKPETRGRKPGQGKWRHGTNGGRPSEYRKANAALALEWSKLGKHDEEIAKIFRISIGTLYRWKREHPPFKHAIERGRIDADAEVIKTTYKAAIGWQHKAVHFSTYKGQVTETPYIEKFPPDMAAAKMILSAHHHDKWGEKSTTTLQGPDGQSAFSPVVIHISSEPRPPERVVELQAAAPAQLQAPPPGRAEGVVEVVVKQEQEPPPIAAQVAALAAQKPAQQAAAPLPKREALDALTEALGGLGKTEP